MIFLAERANGSRYWRWGGRGLSLGAGKTQSHEKCLKMRQNPQRPVHAVLGSLFGNKYIISSLTFLYVY